MEILISGASTGIGKACGIHMAGLGHSVWAGVRSQKDFEAVERLNVRSLKPIFLDVTQDDSVGQCVSHIIKTSGAIDALINNAGIAVGGPIEAVQMEDWRRQLEINFFGVVRLTQACLPHLRESRGRIVNMSSISGRIAFPFMAPYAASKFAVEAYSDSLRREVEPLGLRVSVIEPGAIATPIWEKAHTEGLGRVAKYPSYISEVYGSALKKFSQRLEQTARNAAPVAHVTRAVEHALTSSRPQTRYPVGRGIKLTAFVSRFVPDPILDRVMR